MQALEIDLLSFVPMEVERNVDSAAELRGGLESFFGPETGACHSILETLLAKRLCSAAALLWFG